MVAIFVTGSAKVVMPDQGICKASKLLSILQANGFEIIFDAKADYLLAIDHNKLAYKKFINEGGRPERAFLLRLEPPTVFPSQYRKSVEQKYGTIFTPGSVMQNPGEFIGWPYQIHADPNSPSRGAVKIEEFIANSQFEYRNWVNRKIFLSMIAANKVAPVPAPRYALRREFARKLQSLDFHLYGPLWGRSLRSKMKHRLAVSYFAIKQGTIPDFISIYGDLFSKYPRSLGPIDDKHRVLKNSKFSLVIENSDTYVSEKLFDSLINGCIPVYFGPGLEAAGLPDGIAIQYDGAPHKIFNFLSGISEFEIREKLEAISQFLKSEHFEAHWTEASVYKSIATLMRARICINSFS